MRYMRRNRRSRSQGRDISAEIDHVFVGNCIPGSFETGSVTGRQISLKLGLNKFTITLDTACCSPLTALRMALWGLKLGEYSSALVIGVESMSKVPHVSRELRNGVRIGEVKLKDQIFPISYPGYNPVAIDASDGAEKYDVPKRTVGRLGGRFTSEVVRCRRSGKILRRDRAYRCKKRAGNMFVFSTDESPRSRQRHLRLWSNFPPVFGAKTTTAGNAPGLNDGASAIVVMTQKRASDLGLEPLAAIEEMAGEIDMPHGISWIPALTIKKVLSRAGMDLEQIDLIEINEAFAAMPLVSAKILADGDNDKWFELLQRINVNGGAIAIGHPVGASGLRITMTMMYELRRRGGGLGVAAICGGLTQGEAVIIRA